jgi:hypothetical protein
MSVFLFCIPAVAVFVLTVIDELKKPCEMVLVDINIIDRY